MLSGYSTDVANTESINDGLPVTEVSEDTKSIALLSDDAMPRAPPAEDAMPRAPPTAADTSNYLLYDGAAVISTDNSNTVTPDQLEPIFQQALKLWSETNLSNEQLDRLNSITVQISDLDGGILKITGKTGRRDCFLSKASM